MANMESTNAWALVVPLIMAKMFAMFGSRTTTLPSDMVLKSEYFSFRRNGHNSHILSFSLVSPREADGKLAKSTGT